MITCTYILCILYYCSVETRFGSNHLTTNFWRTCQNVFTLGSRSSAWGWVLHCLTGLVDKRVHTGTPILYVPYVAFFHNRMRTWLVKLPVYVWWWTIGGLTGGHPWGLWWRKPSSLQTKCGLRIFATCPTFGTYIIYLWATSWFNICDTTIVVITCPVKVMTPAFSHPRSMPKRSWKMTKMS